MLPVMTAVIMTVIVTYLSWRYYAFRKTLPPGPKGLPLIGNLHQMPSIYPWRVFTKMRNKYGPIFSMRIGSQTMIVLTTRKTAHDLLDKRSNIYSSRPTLTMVGENISQGNRTVFLPYNEKWKAYHRIQGALLNPNMAKTYRKIQDVESKQLMVELLTRPQDFFFLFHRFSASLLFSLGYGKRMPKGDEPELVGSDKLLETLNEVFIQRWIVDLFPWLNVLPTWLAPWKRYANQIRETEEKFFVGLNRDAAEKTTWNWAKAIPKMKDAAKLTDVELSYVLSNTYEAGSDTILDVLLIFVMAMVLHPEVVRKAQVEIDEVVGRTRLPDFADVGNLPYLNALLKEVHRWRPVIPGGVPHAVTEDDEYMGYSIPRGSMVIACHWAISMDTEIYEDPETFNPERWVKDPSMPLAQFGFGRRRCVGQHLGHASLLIVAARMLWSYDIGKVSEERHGKKVPVGVDSMAFVNGFNSAPLPFKASFIPRESSVPDILKKEFAEVEKDVDVLMSAMRQEQVDAGLVSSDS